MALLLARSWSHGARHVAQPCPQHYYRQPPLKQRACKPLHATLHSHAPSAQLPASTSTPAPGFLPASNAEAWEVPPSAPLLPVHIQHTRSTQATPPVACPGAHTGRDSRLHKGTQKHLPHTYTGPGHAHTWTCRASEAARAGGLGSSRLPCLCHQPRPAPSARLLPVQPRHSTHSTQYTDMIQLQQPLAVVRRREQGILQRHAPPPPPRRPPPAACTRPGTTAKVHSSNARGGPDRATSHGPPHLPPLTAQHPHPQHTTAQGRAASSTMLTVKELPGHKIVLVKPQQDHTHFSADTKSCPAAHVACLGHRLLRHGTAQHSTAATRHHSSSRHTAAVAALHGPWQLSVQHTRGRAAGHHAAPPGATQPLQPSPCSPSTPPTIATAPTAACSQPHTTCFLPTTHRPQHRHTQWATATGSLSLRLPLASPANTKAGAQIPQAGKQIPEPRHSACLLPPSPFACKSPYQGSRCRPRPCHHHHHHHMASLPASAGLLLPQAQCSHNLQVHHNRSPAAAASSPACPAGALQPTALSWLPAQRATSAMRVIAPAPSAKR